LLFGKGRRTIGGHIKNIYEVEELEKSSTWRDYRQVQKKVKLLTSMLKSN